MSEPNPVIEAAREYMEGTSAFKSMKELGIVLGVTSHTVGKKLKEVGLRSFEGDPTDRAISGGYVKSVTIFESFPLVVWHEERTLAVLRPLIQETQK